MVNFLALLGNFLDYSKKLGYSKKRNIRVNYLINFRLGENFPFTSH